MSESDNTRQRATWAHVASMVLGGLGLLWLGRNHWFVLDEWEYVTNRGLDHPALGLFVPHTQHWSTGPILLYRALLNLFGLHTYLPFLALNIAVYVLALHLAWRVAVRAGADRWVATGLAALLLCSAASGNQAFAAFQVAFAGSVAFGLGLLLLVDRHEPLGWKRATATTVLAIVSLTFSSISLPLIGAAIALLALRRGVRVAAAVFSPAVAIYAVWYLDIGRDTIGAGEGSARLTLPVLRHAPIFVRDGLAATFGAPLLLRTGSGLLLLGIFVGVVIAVHRHWRGREAIALAAALGALLFFVLTALGRGADSPAASRYLFVGGALLLPIVAVACNGLVRRGMAVRVVLALGLVVLLLVNVRDLRRVSLAEAAVQQESRDRVVATAAVIRAGSGVPDPAVPDITNDPDLTVGKLRALIESGWVPAPDHLAPAALARARTYPHVIVRSDLPPTESASASASITTVPPDRGSVDPKGCAVVRSEPPATRAVVHASRGAALQITSELDGWIQVLRADRRGRPKGLPVPIILVAGAPVVLDVSRDEAIVVMPLRSTLASVCGLDPA